MNPLRSIVETRRPSASFTYGSLAVFGIGLALMAEAILRSPVVPVGFLAYGQSDLLIARVFWWVFPIAATLWVATITGVCEITGFNWPGYVRLGYVAGAWLMLRVLLLWPAAIVVAHSDVSLSRLDQFTPDWRFFLFVPCGKPCSAVFLLAWLAGLAALVSMWGVTWWFSGVRWGRLALAMLALTILNAVALQLAGTLRHPFLVFVSWAIFRLCIVGSWGLFGEIPRLDKQLDAERELKAFSRP